MGKLGAGSAARPVAEVIAGGAADPFDAIEPGYMAGVGLTKIPPGATGRREVPEFEGLTVLSPPLRVLPTAWLFDGASGTMFTSDLFGHTSLPTPEGPVILREGDERDRAGVDEVRRHLAVKFPWLSRANTGPFVRWLDEAFADFTEEAVAPTHGCVLLGKSVVERHLAMVRTALLNP